MFKIRVLKAVFSRALQRNDADVILFDPLAFDLYGYAARKENTFQYPHFEHFSLIENILKNYLSYILTANFCDCTSSGAGVIDPETRLYPLTENQSQLETSENSHYSFRFTLFNTWYSVFQIKLVEVRHLQKLQAQNFGRFSMFEESGSIFQAKIFGRQALFI